MKKCNGTGLVLKICETKNNVWKKHELSILNGIDNYIKITKIKLDSASLSREKTLGMTENTGFIGSVVANWLQKKCYQFVIRMILICR